ncbi:MAG: hypothetical protein FWD58_08380 [Firmicutes bacterium]|nr:hypothetical protein [Bacillota bacterium]
MENNKKKVEYDEEEIERIVTDLQTVLADLEKHETWLEEMECAAGVEELVLGFVHKRYFEEKHKREITERALDLALDRLRLYESVADHEADCYLMRAAFELSVGSMSDGNEER